MGAWVLDTDGGYVDMTHVQRVFLVSEFSGDVGPWRVQAGSRTLVGSYAIKADAEEAMRNLVNGVTLADLTG